VLTINFSGLELKMFFSLQSSWLLSYCYQMVALKDTVPIEGGEFYPPAPPPTPSSFKMLSSKTFRGETFVNILKTKLLSRTYFVFT
jgi:hypothetical protein